MNQEEIKKYIQSIKEYNETESKEYYYVVLGGYYVKAGHYWNSDIHAYTPEGDEVIETSGWKSPIFSDWNELINALDEDLLLADEVEDLNPNELCPTTDKKDRKVLYSYEYTRFETDEDEYGHYWEGDVTYDIIICEV